MNGPARLHKKEDNVSPFLNKLDEWALNNAHIILPIFIILGLIIFVMLCYAIIGVSATDSGLQYNHIKDVI